MNHDGSAPNVEKDVALFESLCDTSHPLHASPLEHAACPARDQSEHSGNFQGWIQFRKLVEDLTYRALHNPAFYWDVNALLEEENHAH